MKLLPRLLELELAGARAARRRRPIRTISWTMLRYSKGSMAKSLVIVESPAKAKTINKYLGRDYKVLASMGHVRDLPKSKLGVDVDEGFAPVYEPLAARKKVIAELKSAAKDATDIYIATDPDREGEAIGWHLAEELGTKKKKIHRLMFNEITKKAVQEAMKHPGAIDMKMVDAQQARRVLDRLVGYKISPILWDKVRRGLSAGRVQSVALKLICDREQEIAQVRSGGVLAPVCVARRSAAAGVRGQARQAGRRDPQDRQRAAVEGRAARSRRRDLRRVVGRDQRAQAQRRAPVHHQQAAADRALSGEADDADCPAAVRRRRAARAGRRRAGRPHYLYAHRFDPRLRRCADRGSHAHRRDVRRRTTCRRSRTPSRPSPMRRTRTKRSGRRRWSTTRKKSDRF